MIFSLFAHSTRSHSDVCSIKKYHFRPQLRSGSFYNLQKLLQTLSRFPSISTILRMGFVKDLLLRLWNIAHSWFIHSLLRNNFRLRFCCLSLSLFPLSKCNNNISSRQYSFSRQANTHTHVPVRPDEMMNGKAQKKKQLKDCEQRKGKKTDTKSLTFFSFNENFQNSL